MEFWEDYETLRIETPEGLDLFLPLAGFGPRFLAFLLDMIAVGAVQIILVVVAIAVFAGTAAAATVAPDEMTGVMILMMAVFIIVVMFAPVFYFMIFESVWAGQSPGKRAVGIRVVRRGGFPVGRREIFMRNVMRLIDMLPSNWIVGVISFFATKNQQRVGDVVADTVVVREFSGRRPVTSPMSYGAGDVDLKQPVGTLSPQVSYAISSYLQRAGGLSDAAREHLSLRLIEALGYNGSHLALSQREGYLASIVQQGWAQQ